MEGNQMKMREALGDVYNILEKIQSFTPRLNDVSLMREFRSMICHAKRVIDTALAAPVRNCDVGTAEEQAERFGKLCAGRVDCVGCPCNKGGGISSDCFAKWKQMSYAEEGGKA